MAEWNLMKFFSKAFLTCKDGCLAKGALKHTLIELLLSTSYSWTFSFWVSENSLLSVTFLENNHKNLENENIF